MEVGDRIKSNNFGYFNIVSKDGRKYSIVFEETGYIRKNCNNKTVSCGGVVDPTGNTSIEVGRILNTTAYGELEIISARGTKDISVRFVNTGNLLERQQKHSILAGLILDKAEQSRTIESKKEEKLRKSKEYSNRLLEIKSLRDSEELTKKQLRDDLAEAAKLVKQKKALAQKLADDDFASIPRRHDFFGEYILLCKVAESSWRIKFLESGNEYVYQQKLIVRNSIHDRGSSKFKEYEKLYSKGLYEQNREHRIEQATQYQKDNVERTNNRNANRRARRKKAEGSHTLDETKLLAESQDNLCTCCGSPLIKGNKHLDHIMPIALGGSNYVSNLQYLCRFCNLTKNASHPDDWISYSESDIFLFTLFNRLTKWHFENQDIL